MIKHLIQFTFILCVLSNTQLTSAETLPLSKPLTEQVSVTGQMTTDKFNQLLKQGFKSIIVNRPDDEQGNQTSEQQLRHIANEAQINFVYQPVTSGKITQTDIVKFAHYYNDLPKPILMICRSGSRSTFLFNQAKAQGLLNE